MIYEMIRITSLGSLAAEIFFGWDQAGSITRFKELSEELNLGQAADADEILTEIPQILKDAGAVFLFKLDPNLSYEAVPKTNNGGQIDIKLAE